MTKLRVEPLPVDHIRRLVQGRLGVDALPEALARQVTEKVGQSAVRRGDRELSHRARHAARCRGQIGARCNEVAAALPGTVQNLLTVRVDRLAAKDRTLLQAASAIGRRFDPELLAVSAGETDIDARLEAMQALDLVRREGKSSDYEFKHALVQDSLYQSLLTEPRKALRVGEIGHSRATFFARPQIIETSLRWASVSPSMYRWVV